MNFIAHNGWTKCWLPTWIEGTIFIIFFFFFILLPMLSKIWLFPKNVIAPPGEVGTVFLVWPCMTMSCSEVSYIVYLLWLRFFKIICHICSMHTCMTCRRYSLTSLCKFFHPLELEGSAILQIARFQTWICEYLQYCHTPVHLVESAGYCGLCMRRCLECISCAHVMHCALVIMRGRCYDASAKQHYAQLQVTFSSTLKHRL